VVEEVEVEVLQVELLLLVVVPEVAVRMSPKHFLQAKSRVPLQSQFPREAREVLRAQTPQVVMAVRLRRILRLELSLLDIVVVVVQTETTVRRLVEEVVAVEMAQWVRTVPTQRVAQVVVPQVEPLV
jgi:hypothetical protein